MRFRADRAVGQLKLAPFITELNLVLSEEDCNFVFLESAWLSHALLITAIMAAIFGVILCILPKRA